MTFLLCAGTALLLGATCARADDHVKTRHARHHQTVAEKAPVAKKGGQSIPTRDGRHAQFVDGRAAGGASGPEYRVRTGSHIPQHYNRRGYTTDSPDNEFIYDKNDIRLRKATDVNDSLRSVPGLTVSRP